MQNYVKKELYMSKVEIKELIIMLIFSIINLCIAYFITFNLGIQNTILFRTYTAVQQDITYEVLIFMFLSFIEAFIYHIKFELVKE